MSQSANNLEKHEFQSEAKQVLELMINSVYSNPDIFLRELISNASDAIDKLRIEGLSNETISGLARDGKITVTIDRDARSVTVSDNGLGMSRDELISYLGTIARSGTKEFIRAMRDAQSGGSDLIGQFGVGFYSSFIVASKVTVRTRRAGDDESWVWDSSGDGTFTVEPGDMKTNGTDIILCLKERTADEDDDTKDYLSAWTLRNIIKQYSDFVSYPICVVEKGKNSKDDGEPVNSMKALWTRPESEVTSEEYFEFYRHIAHDWETPIERIVYKTEGTNEFHALMFIPSRPPMDLYYREGKHGVQLYIRRVFIMNDCRDLIPEYMRFIKGVVDSEDLPLNVSREILQQDRQTSMIKRSLTRKILDSLKKIKQERPDDYKKFWMSFGPVLKEGLVSDHKNGEAIMKLCLFNSSKGERTTLDDYVASMKEKQNSIYYITGSSTSSLLNSPKLESFKKRGVEVLLLGDPVDELWVTTAGKFGDYPFISVVSADVEIEGDEKESAEDKEAAKRIEETGFLARIKDAFSRQEGIAKSVEDVRLSTRLVDSPATFVQLGDPVSAQMRNMFKTMGQDLPEEKRVLELNPNHPLIRKIAALPEADKDKFEIWSTILSGLAQVSDGEPVENGRVFTATLTKLLEG
ncbi:MAG: molecular chaperone HtpG [Synergistaceae bacterium]|jgi:molecular chaperone HtpG|nr:molecular chaperone HtpG [Synergistaceae bacterium]